MKLGDIMQVVKAAGYCKRDAPSQAQIRLFLKKEKSATKEALRAITEDNVVEQFAQISSAI